MPQSLRYLLLQVRNPDDPMRGHEVACFARSLECDEDRIEVLDLMTSTPGAAQLDRIDVVLLGGSGDYSVAEGGPWLAPALDAMRELVEREKPTFASCWGFQAMARALGGVVVTDLERAELGTIDLTLTDAGRADPVFGMLNSCGNCFPVQIGHQDIVDALPGSAVRLASSPRVVNEAFMIPGKPIWATQFHPELRKEDLLKRLRQYPSYVEKIAGVPFEEFAQSCRETPKVERLLRRFIEVVFK